MSFIPSPFKMWDFFSHFPHVWAALSLALLNRMWQKWCYEAHRTGHPEALHVHLPLLACPGKVMCGSLRAPWAWQLRHLSLQAALPARHVSEVTLNLPAHLTFQLHRDTCMNPGDTAEKPLSQPTELWEIVNSYCFKPLILPCFVV